MALRGHGRRTSSMRTAKQAHEHAERGVGKATATTETLAQRTELATVWSGLAAWSPRE